MIVMRELLNGKSRQRSRRSWFRVAEEAQWQPASRHPAGFSG
jgi:hypothetical protein